jgi:hypothetical protein
MEKIVTFSPAWDKRNPIPNKNYGIHGVDLRMVLKGDKGAVQFLLYTNWMLPHVEEELDTKLLVESRQGKLNKYSFSTIHPMSADLGYHSPISQYEGQSIMSESCNCLDGKPCYYDGSGLDAERIYDVLLKEGSDGVWRELEDYYNMIFESED